MLDNLDSFITFARRHSRAVARDEQRDIAMRIAAGDNGALDTLTEAYLFDMLQIVLATIEAWDIQKREIPSYIDAGLSGLARAATAWSEGSAWKSHDFLPYATWWIRQYVNSYHGDHGA